eukprot:TRINITY_DN4519_c0_g1_i1.p1 TRINITY_DN4519_c0_g1~~TRINITY_DN4519_c0_g1_i1.p1  ORF type:complete len:1529 (-),score=494.33 TRINITY_DN4519_c0_g1_i1:1256-5488(-)
MCKYACEECTLSVFTGPQKYAQVELLPSSILDNIENVIRHATGEEDSEFPYDLVESLIRDRKRVDNIIVLSHTLISASENAQMFNVLQKYREEVNPNMLFVSVNLSGKGVSILPTNEAHPNDIMINGFSDSILRFVAERGDVNQLRYVENIDIAKNVKSQANEMAPSYLNELESLGELLGDDPSAGDDDYLHSPSSSWRTARVFISSTFLDMHAERDVLTRFVFPELKQRCLKRRIHLAEVDLRWGVTQEETQQNKSIQICLEEVDRCRPFFVGILGQRYGWVPSEYTLPDLPQFDWVKNYPKGRSITELEFEYGCLAKPADSSALFYFRDDALERDIPAEFKSQFVDSQENLEKLKTLKTRVRSAGAKVRDYKCLWGGVRDGKPLVRGLEAFRQSVLEDLWGAICSQFEEPVGPALIDPLAEERAHHWEFIHSRAGTFHGRKVETSKLNAAIDDVNAQSLVVVTGKAGAGKSSLLAHWSLNYAKNHKWVHVLPHFVGAGGPNSTTVRHILFRFCRELRHQFGPFDAEIPTDYKALVQAFQMFLEHASFQKKVVIVIDGIDQLGASDRAASMEWLPSDCKVKFVVSGVAESPAIQALKKRNTLKIEMGGLDPKDRQVIVRNTLAQYRKKLDDRPMNDQERVLLKKMDADKPLYLILACSELRVFGVFEQLTEKIKEMGQTIPRLLEEVLARMESDHGRDRLKQILALLVCSRGGLTEGEIMVLMARKDKGETKFPDALWSRLHSSLHMFMRATTSATGEVMYDIFHKEMVKAIRKRYLDMDLEYDIKTHRSLAEYFLEKADPVQDGSWGGSSLRSFSELPHHLIKAKMWKVVDQTLCSLTFIETKCTLGLAFDLNGDYVEACSEDVNWKGGDKERDHVEQFFKFFQANSHILSQNPDLTYQQAINQPDSTSPHVTAASTKYTRPYLEWINKPQVEDACRLTIKLTEPVTAIALHPTLDHIACAMKDCTLRIFSSSSGLELMTMAGHSNWITSCSYSGDGAQILTSSWDQTIRIWETSTGAEALTLTGHDRLVSCAAFSPNNKFVISGSWDCSLKTWDPITGKNIKTLRGHSKPINTVSFTMDSLRIVSADWDGVILLWNAEELTQISKFSSPNLTSIRCVTFSPNGKQILSAGMDTFIHLWDAQAGKEISQLRGHSKPVTNISFSADGQQLVSADEEGTIKIWDGILGSEVFSSKVPSGWMNNVAYSQDGTQIVAAGSECQVWVWDALTLTISAKLVGHTRAVTCAVFCPDGKILSASEDHSLILWSKSVKAVQPSEENYTMEYIPSQTLKGHTDVVAACAVSPDGMTAVSASDDFSAILWDLTSGQILKQMKHGAVVKACAFSPNGKYIATGGRTSVVHLWNARQGAEIATFAGHLDWVNVLQFSQDSKKIVSGSWDYNLKVWNVKKRN